MREREGRSGVRGWRSSGGRALLPAWEDAAAVGFTALVGTAVFWLVHRALIDDAYITLVQARDLARLGQWSLLPGHLSNTATSPLNAMLIAALMLVLHGPVQALGALFVLNSAVLAAGLLGLARHMGLGRRLAVLAGPLLVLNPLLSSTIGLETMLAVTALVLLVWLSGLDRSWPFGVVAGLTVLIRLDLAVVVGVVFCLRPRQWRRALAVAGWALLVALPWYLFSWVALGSAIPDTLLIKEGHAWGPFWSGLVTRYVSYDGVAVVATLASCLVGLVAVCTWAWWRGRVWFHDTAVVPILGAVAAAYYLTFLALRVSPFHWYYGVPVAALVLCGSVAVAALTAHRAALLRLGAAGAALVVTVVPTGLAWGRAAASAVPLRVSMIESNWAHPGQYARIGRELSRRVGQDVPVASPGEIGTLLYFCHCTLVDHFSDRGQLAHDIARAKRRSLLMRVNYLWLDPADLHPMKPRYRLRFREGPDRSGWGWNISSGSRQGHLALVPASRSSRPRERAVPAAAGRASTPRTAGRRAS